MPARKTIRITATEPLSDDYRRLEKISFDYGRTDGSTQQLTREIYHVDDGVSVLPYDLQRRSVLLVRQFRLPAYLRGQNAFMLEAPAGFLEGGEIEASARREVEEETGYRVGSLEKAFEAMMVPGCITHVVHGFVAPYTPADRVGPGGGLAEEGEDIDVAELPIERAIEMIAMGEISDGKTIMLLQYLAWRVF
jgi:nudix-type nucleoside diphosphatase (YffH/AdpP family)